MLLALIAPVFAEATDRLEGVHFGVGVGMGWYTYTTTYEGQYSTSASVSSYTSLRLRLGKRWAIEPTLTLARSGGTETQEDSAVTVSEQSDRYVVGVRVRPLIASVDRVDFVGAVGVRHGRQWWKKLTDNADDELDPVRETTFAAATTAEVGVALEYWITPRVSVSAEVGTDVFSASVYTREPEMTVDESYAVTFAPSGDVVFHLYF
jgi:hypothetical protein